MEIKTRKKESDDSYQKLVAELLPKIRDGAIVCVKQDNRVVQINLTVRQEGC